MREGREGVVGRTYYIQPKNKDIIIVIDGLHPINATALTVRRQPPSGAHRWLLMALVGACCAAKWVLDVRGCWMPFIDVWGGPHHASFIKGRSLTVTKGGGRSWLLGCHIHSWMVVGTCSTSQSPTDSCRTQRIPGDS